MFEKQLLAFLARIRGALACERQQPQAHQPGVRQQFVFRGVLGHVLVQPFTEQALQPCDQEIRVRPLGIMDLVQPEQAGDPQRAFLGDRLPGEQAVRLVPGVERQIAPCHIHQPRIAGCLGRAHEDGQRFVVVRIAAQQGEGEVAGLDRTPGSERRLGRGEVPVISPRRIRLASRAIEGQRHDRQQREHQQRFPQRMQIQPEEPQTLGLAAWCEQRLFALRRRGFGGAWRRRGFVSGH